MTEEVKKPKKVKLTPTPVPVGTLSPFTTTTPSKLPESPIIPTPIPTSSEPPKDPVPVKGPVPVPVQTGEWTNEGFNLSGISGDLFGAALEVFDFFGPLRHRMVEGAVQGLTSLTDPENWMPSQTPGLSVGDAKLIYAFQQWAKENDKDPTEQNMVDFLGMTAKFPKIGPWEGTGAIADISKEITDMPWGVRGTLQRNRL